MVAKAKTMPEPENIPTPAKKRKYRLHPGTKALREIKKMQKTTHTLLPRTTFERLVREIVADFSSTMRLRHGAVDALQQAIEQYVVDVLKCSNGYAVHARRKTISVPDLQAATAGLARSD